MFTNCERHGTEIHRAQVESARSFRTDVKTPVIITLLLAAGLTAPAQTNELDLDDVFDAA